MTPNDEKYPSGELSFMEKLRRRKYWRYPFVDKKLQFNFALLLGIIGLFNVLYFSVLFYFYSQHFFTMMAQLFPDYTAPSDIFHMEYRLFLKTIAFAGIFELILILLLGLFFSHRIAGPLYAMSIKLKEISRGGIPRQIKLRKEDLLMNFADRLNEAILKLSDQRGELEQALADAKEGHLDRVKSRLEKLTTPEPELAASLPHAEPPQA